MKTIKLKICGYNPDDKFSLGSFFLPRLKQWYNVELSEEPDYVIFYESTAEHLRYPNAIRIFFTGENVHPDFNLADYAISFDYLSFGDRHFRLPIYLVTTFYSEEDIKNAADFTSAFEKVPPMTHEELARKTGFCSFVYSNYLADPRRKELFDALSAYKKVDSGGRYLNNIGGPVPNKLLFEREHKFSIAFENSSREGYTTEKLPGSLAARTIPIHFGNPLVGKEFNTKRFINVHDFPSLDAVVARVRELDENDEEYLRVINQPVLAEGYHFDDAYRAFDAFLRNIFDQPKEAAVRRHLNAMRQRDYEKRERIFGQVVAFQNAVRSVAATIYKPLKRIPGLDELKVRISQLINRA